jgi:hypothetical protein
VIDNWLDQSQILWSVHKCAPASKTLSDQVHQPGLGLNGCGWRMMYSLAHSQKCSGSVPVAHCTFAQFSNRAASAGTTERGVFSMMAAQILEAVQSPFWPTSDRQRRKLSVTASRKKGLSHVHSPSTMIVSWKV